MTVVEELQLHRRVNRVVIYKLFHGDKLVKAHTQSTAEWLLISGWRRRNVVVETFGFGTERERISLSLPLNHSPSSATMYDDDVRQVIR